MNLLTEFHRITKQIRGKENMFGYETTTANQLYLLYCICGKIYFTDKIHSQMKYFWFFLNLSGILVAYSIGLVCFFYDTKQDVRMQLEIMNAVGISTDLGIFFPVIVYYYREGIEAMISGIDQVLKSKPKSLQQHEPRDRINAKTMIVTNFSIVLAMDLIYLFICHLDLMFFYEESKVKNFMYYTLPLPNIDEHGSKKLLYANFLMFMFFSPLFWFQWIAGVSMISLWGATCHNELIFVRDQFDHKMDILNDPISKKYNQNLSGWNRVYKKILVKDVHDFNRIAKVINHFRGFVELFCSISIPVDFLVQVAQLYVTISVDAVSFSIYCSPWYWSTAVRKDVHIFLNQTRRTKNLFMIKVYPLLLSNFARFAHTILSCVNILRRLTVKSKSPSLYRTM
ncbi:uncharacterized protein LOC135846787 [Planococcus citri]|uniref:uncharacterized protein LOC135846787 n=1 Tax=Planococcus citri TaxID=170843 RepID=UPI0031FA2341